MFTIKESDYQQLVKTAIRVRNEQRNPDVTEISRFTYMNELPTIHELQQNNIIPDKSGDMDENILAYLIFYAETETLDEDGEDWEYIFIPDRKVFTAEEINEFEETRRYIERVIQKCVKIK